MGLVYFLIIKQKCGRKVMQFKKVVGKFGRSMTVNHAKRVWNTDSQKAIGVIKEQMENKQGVFSYPCPFCSISNVKFSDRYWRCPSCDYTYPVKQDDPEALKAFMDKYAREIYLSGKGVENSAYEQQGGFFDSAVIYLKVITTSYLCSKIALAIAVYSLFNVFSMALDGRWLMTFVFLLMMAVAMMYSLFFAFKGYCVATKQMFVKKDIGHFEWWLSKVGVLYFLNIAKRQDIDLEELIDEFEQYEKEVASFRANDDLDSD